MGFADHSLTELLSFLDGLPEPHIVMDAEYRIVAANAAYVRDFGDGQAIRGRRCYEVSHHFTVPCDQAGESCPLKASLETGGARRVLHLHHTPRGEQHVDVETTPIRDESGKVAFFVESMRIVHHARGQQAAQGMVGRAPAFNHMLERLMRAASSEAAVLLLGDTGTGKELAARVVHEASPRAEGPFVTVEGSGLTETLFESELFGYEKGAFTGANFRKTGLVEAASGGTLFLDEIGDVPLSLQVKLLRLLETGTYRRVGGIETLRADFRLVCATHRGLATMVKAELFRRDLYYRINSFPVHVPSLEQRREDIPLLAHSLLERVAGRRGLRLSEAALTYLKGRRYEGNIRELRNLVERASLLVDGPEIGVEHLTDDCAGEAVTAPGAAPQAEEAIVTLAEAERRYLRWAVERNGGDRKALAALLGVSERTLFRKLARTGLHSP